MALAAGNIGARWTSRKKHRSLVSLSLLSKAGLRRALSLAIYGRRRALLESETKPFSCPVRYPQMKRIEESSAFEENSDAYCVLPNKINPTSSDNNARLELRNYMGNLLKSCSMLH